MVFKNLFLGLTFTIGIFALKSGVGLHYFLIQKRNLKTRLIFLLLYSLVYLLVFIISSHILRIINIIHYFNMVQGFLKSGMFIHLLIAGGLIVWGIILLKGKEKPDRISFGWMALIIPCPVCITAIFFGAAFLLSYFPDSAYMAVLLAYLGFMAVAAITVISMTLLGQRLSIDPDSILGAAMLLIAVYFFLSVIMMPQFHDVEKIYRLGAYKGEGEPINLGELLALYSIMTVFFMGGFLNRKRRLRRRMKWI